MVSEKEKTPLLWREQRQLKGARELQGSILGDMPGWQGGAGQDPRRPAGDAESLDLFTEVGPALPVSKEKQNANIVGAVFYSMLLAVYGAIVIASTILVPRPHNYLVTAITCSCNAILLAITAMLQGHLVAEQQKEKRQGYIKFSKRLDYIIHMPFSVVSIGTTGLLLAVVWQPAAENLGLPALLLMRALILLEIVVTAVLIGAYLHKVCRHHSLERAPDVMSSLYSPLNPPDSVNSVRYNDGGLAEQQAVLLHYQQDNLRYLSEEILRLQETLSKYDSSQYGGASQEDVVHHLAAREQELRAVEAERDQLLIELRLARGLIAERDVDIKQVKAINQQYVEENERVRAMLDEWSSRAAKLEMALEAERLSNVDLQKKCAMLRHHSGEPK